MSSLNLNKVILAGHLTIDPEMKTTQSGSSVVSFAVAVNRRFKSADGSLETDFISCKAWNKTAEFVSQYFKKGSSICLVGNIQTHSWEDKDGNSRRSTDVVADEVYFVDSKSGTDAKADGNKLPSVFTGEQLDKYNAEQKKQAETKAAPKFEDADSADLPF